MIPFRPKAFLMKVKKMIISATPANNPIIIANVFSASSWSPVNKKNINIDHVRLTIQRGFKQFNARLLFFSLNITQKSIKDRTFVAA